MYHIWIVSFFPLTLVFYWSFSIVHIPRLVKITNNGESILWVTWRTEESPLVHKITSSCLSEVNETSATCTPSFQRLEGKINFDNLILKVMTGSILFSKVLKNDEKDRRTHKSTRDHIYSLCFSKAGRVKILVKVFETFWTPGHLTSFTWPSRTGCCLFNSMNMKGSMGSCRETRLQDSQK